MWWMLKSQGAFVLSYAETKWSHKKQESHKTLVPGLLEMFTDGAK